ncbi:hypothetical protein IC582_012424 [Cucumis melo]
MQKTQLFGVSRVEQKTEHIKRRKHKKHETKSLDVGRSKQIKELQIGNRGKQQEQREEEVENGEKQKRKMKTVVEKKDLFGVLLNKKNRQKRRLYLIVSLFFT